MFNKRDRRCAAVQLIPSTDPSYDNGTIASTLKMQIRTVQRLRAQLNTSDDPLEVMERKATSYHLTSSKSAWKSTPSVPGCAEECGDPLVQSGGLWQTLGVAAGLGAGLQIQRDPGLASEGVLRLCTLLSLPPPSPIWTRWTTSFGHTSRTSPTWPPTTPKPAWSPPSVEYSPSSHRRFRKRHAPSSGSVSTRWLRLKAGTLNRCQLYYIIKLPELIFSIKVLK